jgi:hypothetical protein
MVLIFFMHFLYQLILVPLFGTVWEDAVNGSEDNRRLVVFQVTDYKYDE